MDERQNEAAKRIFDLIPIWDRDPEKTEEQQINDIYNMISLDPTTTINYLLDLIDELQA